MAGRQQVTIKGMDQLMRKLRALPEVVAVASARAVRDETEEVADDMRRDAPELTGALKAGIQAEYDASTITGRAVSTARHTTFVVHGTSDTPENDFMTPAAERSRNGRFRERVISEVRAELRKVTK